MDSRLLWLALAAFVGSTEGGLIAGLLPSISEDMDITPGQAGQAVLGYSIAYALGTPFLAVLLGGIGRRRILAGAQLTLALCALLIALSPYFGWLVGARSLLAVAAGLFTSTALAVAAMIAAPGQRGRALQIVSLGQAMAVLIGVPAGAWVATQMSWRVDYFGIALMAAVAALALFVMLPRGMHGDGDTQTMRARVRVLANPGMPPALLVTLLFMVGAYSPLVYIGAVMDAAGIDRAALPLVLLVNGVGAVAASLTAGRIADQFGNRATVVVMALVLLVALMGFWALTHIADEGQLPLLLLSNMVMGYVGWGYWIAHCSEVANLAPSSVTVAISLNMAALNLGVAVAAGAGGLIVDGWGANALALSGVPIAIVALVLWVIVTQPKAADTANDVAQSGDIRH